MDRETAIALVREKTDKDITFRHLVSVEGVMRRLAQHFGEDEQTWGRTGLFHDLDQDRTAGDADRHAYLAAEWLREAGEDEVVVNGVLAHAHTQFQTDLMSRSIVAADAVAGLLVAAALPRPEKAVGMKVSSVKKKLKEKSFAPGVNRDEIHACTEIGLELDRFIELGIEGLQLVAPEIGAGLSIPILRRPYSSWVRRICVIAACIGALVAGASPARAARSAAQPGRVLVIGMPETEARRFLTEHPSALGLGVFPDSRSSVDFLTEVGVAAPRGLPGTPSPLGGAPGKLRAALDNGGKTVGVAVLSSAEATPTATLAAAFGTERVPVHEALTADVAVVVVQLADDAEAVVRTAGTDRTVIVVGAGAQTPLLIGVLGSPGLLDHGVAERPGVVTPYDLAATIARAAGVTPVPGGRVLQVRPSAQPLAELDVLRARFLRDRGFGPGLTGTTSGLAIFGAVLGVLFVILKRPKIAAPFARAAAMVPAGYVGSLFVPSSHWYVRATVLVAAFLVGLLWPSRSAKRFCGVVVLITAIAIGVLTVVASRNPGGEPALSLWGDPLNSWRFFGIRNHLAAFLAGGYVLGTALLEAPVWLMLPGAVAAGIVVGAPTLGAQFIGVLTLAFGAALELLGAIQRRVRAWHVPIAVVVASGAAAGALFADAGRLYSHGGTAVESIRAGGWRTAWEFFRLRARLNYGEISSLGPKGFITFVLVALALAWLFVWAVRSSSLPPILRAGVAGVAAAGMAALVVEDSGFLTAGIYLLYPALGFATGYADLALDGARRGGAPPAEKPPHDSGDHDHADDDAHERE